MSVIAILQVGSTTKSCREEDSDMRRHSFSDRLLPVLEHYHNPSCLKTQLLGLRPAPTGVPNAQDPAASLRVDSKPWPPGASAPLVNRLPNQEKAHRCRAAEFPREPNQVKPFGVELTLPGGSHS